MDIDMIAFEVRLAKVLVIMPSAFSSLNGGFRHEVQRRAVNHSTNLVDLKILHARAYLATIKR